MLEDNKDYAFNCAENGIRVILFDRSWNKDCKINKNIIRIKSWEEALEKIKEIENAIRKN